MSINLLSEKKKRGRKKKNDIVEIKNEIQKPVETQNNITIIKQPAVQIHAENKTPILTSFFNGATTELKNNDIQKMTENKQKRGRRAKNSKLILPPQPTSNDNIIIKNNIVPIISNIILHLDRKSTRLNSSH